MYTQLLCYVIPVRCLVLQANYMSVPYCAHLVIVRHGQLDTDEHGNKHHLPHEMLISVSPRVTNSCVRTYPSIVQTLIIFTRMASKPSF